jgi:tetratricopeptide (TPR) repeat protein
MRSSAPLLHLPHLYRIVRVVAVAAVIAAAAAPAEAQVTDPATKRRAEAIATEAKILFQQKQFQEAADRFMEAFTLVPTPALVFNAARAAEEAQNFPKAVALFRHYAGIAGVPPDGKADAEARVAKLEAAIKAAQLKPEPLPQPQPQPQPQPKPIAPAKPVAPPVIVRTWSRFHTLTAATGAVMLGVGGATYGLALNEQASANELFPKLKTEADATTYHKHVSNAKAWRATAAVAGGIGVAVVGWAVYDWWQGAPPPAASPSPKRAGALPVPEGVRLALLPTFDGALLLLRGAF